MLVPETLKKNRLKHIENGFRLKQALGIFLPLRTQIEIVRYIYCEFLIIKKNKKF